jgi:hypothetical protein
MGDSHVIEIILAACNVAVIFVNLSINAKLAEMKTTMFREFLTKDDFREWTKANSRFVNFKEK